MSKEEQIQRMKGMMAKFIAHTGKKLPDDVIAKLRELRDKEDSPLAKTIYDTMFRNQELAVKLNRQTTVERIGAEAYSIGELDAEGAAAESEASIYTAKGFTVDGLKVTVAEDAEVEYTLYFYDADGEFLSATEALSEDFGGTIPETAEMAKIVITPTADEDGKVSLTELFGYAGQVTVQVNR